MVAVDATCSCPCVYSLPSSPIHSSYLSLQEQVERDYIATHYAALTADLPVEVRWIDADKGKGLFSKRAVRMFQPIFSEAPLVSHRKLVSGRDPTATPSTHPSCAQCLRTFVSKEAVLKTRFAPVWDRIYGKGDGMYYCCWFVGCVARLLIASAFDSHRRVGLV